MIPGALQEFGQLQGGKQLCDRRLTGATLSSRTRYAGLKPQVRGAKVLRRTNTRRLIVKSGHSSKMKQLNFMTNIYTLSTKSFINILFICFLRKWPLVFHAAMVHPHIASLVISLATRESLQRFNSTAANNLIWKVMYIVWNNKVLLKRSSITYIDGHIHSNRVNGPVPYEAIAEKIRTYDPWSECLSVWWIQTTHAIIICP